MAPVHIFYFERCSVIAATDARSASYSSCSASVAGLGVACPQSGQKAFSLAVAAGYMK